MSNSILVIDDDAFLSESLRELLTGQGWKVRTAVSAEEGLRSIVEQPPHLLILDLSLPDEDGVSLCRKVRAKWTFPIIMLTSRTDLMDKVLGLEMGADDYLTKPFEGRELIARVRAHLRRISEYQVEDESRELITHGPIVMNLKTHEVSADGHPIGLTALEFRLLHLLMSNCDRVLPRNTLFETVWGYEESFNSNSLDVFLYRLRTKLERQCGIKLIHTVRGYGVKFSVHA